jgi:hypothetical protein
MCLDDALGGLPTGLEGRTFAAPGGHKGDHCSAFAATGKATADGRIVFGHITMFMLPFAEQYNLWLDVQPEQGHRVAMQCCAGSIWSGLDWYQNDAGILLTETTIGQTRFDRNGVPLASRARKAMQYGETIDTVVAILQKDNNGLYSNEWLIGDTKTDEIAMFELGTAATKLWRSSKNEWVAGTEGFYWGCNNERELPIRLEQLPSLLERPRELGCSPTDRDCKWLELFDRAHGRIDASFARLAFTTPPLAASHSLDAKYTTSALAERMQSVALFGPPRGTTWEPTADERAQYPEIRALVHHDWTLLGPLGAPPPAGPAVDLADIDLADAAGGDGHGADEVEPAPAWHGSLLPGADLWLSIAFAAHEPMVAAMRAPDERYRELHSAALLRFRAQARWQHAVRSLGRDVPLDALQPDPRRREWHDLAVGKGVLLLEDLRQLLGDDAYCALMDAFGRAHAGQPASSADFTAAAERAAGHPLGELWQRWLHASPEPGPARWSATAFEEEPEQTLIVYGTQAEAPANREAALLLQRRVASTWHNHDVAVVADRDVTDAQLAQNHLVLVGRPRTNAVAASALAVARGFAVRFGADSFEVAGQQYGHERSAVIAAGQSPFAARWSLVVYAGNSSEATRMVAEQKPLDCEVFVLPHGSPPQPLAVTDAGAPPAATAPATPPPATLSPTARPRGSR